MLNNFLFIVFPYIAVIIAVMFTIYRFITDRYSYSSYSSQFLESKALFWGSVPWHYGIIIILLIHIFALIIPGAYKWLLVGSRIELFESIGLGLALLSFVGLIILAVRRLANSKVSAVSFATDWLLLYLFLFQIGTGIYIALTYRWGSLWYLGTIVPWIDSLVSLTPNNSYVTVLPMVVKLHILNAFFLILIFPFTRLVHMISVPIPYLWRPYELVRWYKNNRGGI